MAPPAPVDQAILRTLDRVSRLASGALVLASLALLASAVLVGLQVADGHDETTPTTGDGTTASVPTIGVIGRGTAEIVPNAAVIVVGVEGTWPTITEAIGRVETAIDAIGAAGADPSSARVVAYRVTTNPAAGTEGVPTSPQPVQVNYRVAVTLRDLNRLDAVLASAAQAGVSVFGVGIGVEDFQPVLNEARERAVADARARAEHLASSLGVTILHADVAEELTSPLPPSPLAVAVADPSVPPPSPSSEVVVEVVVRFAVR